MFQRRMCFLFTVNVSWLLNKLNTDHVSYYNVHSHYTVLRWWKLEIKSYSYVLANRVHTFTNIIHPLQYISTNTDCLLQHVYSKLNSYIKIFFTLSPWYFKGPLFNCQNVSLCTDHRKLIILLSKIWPLIYAI